MTATELMRAAIKHKVKGDATHNHTNPDYMREQQRRASRNTERRDLVRELMLRHPQLTGPQAIEQADEIIETLEGMRDGR